MRKIGAVACLAAILASGCGGVRHDTRPWPDSEEHPKGDGYFLDEREAKWLGADEFRVVSRHEADALARLEEAPAVELSVEEAMRFADRPPGGAGGCLVLLRAMAITERLDKFHVISRDGAVQVQHVDHVIGQPKPQIRRAVIAWLPALPKYVHITIGIAD